MLQIYIKKDIKKYDDWRIQEWVKDLKNIANKIEELGLSREREIKNETKRELNMLDGEISNILEKLNVNVTTLKLRCRFCEKPHNFKKERELRLLAKEKNKWNRKVERRSWK